MQSSMDPTQVSNRVRGIVLLSAGAIIWGAGYLFSLPLTMEDVTELAGVAGMAAGSAWALWGAILALLTWVTKVRD